MKIEFEIDEKESVLFLDIIKRFMGQTSDPEVLKSLSRIVNEIESDLKIGDEIFKQIVSRLAPYSNGNTINSGSDLRIFLGMSDNFLTRIGGLEREMNVILTNLVNKYSPGQSPPKIPLSIVKACEKISDIVSIIQKQYESL